jgi:Dak1 domain
MDHTPKLGWFVVNELKERYSICFGTTVLVVVIFYFITTDKMAKPKKILNDPNDSVSEFIEGLLLQYPNHLAKLENHNVVMIRNGNNVEQAVHLICGGGSGHEPSHAGFIGNGMLSAAVCGGIFASPSVASILAAIRATAATYNSNTEPCSILLIVKNYTGDRLNFGMAAEKANQEGIHTEMVVVSDDCALPRTKVPVPLYLFVFSSIFCWLTLLNTLFFYKSYRELRVLVVLLELF